MEQMFWSHVALQLFRNLIILIPCFQVQGANYSQTQSGIPPSADRGNWELPNQVQQFQPALSGSGQGTSEVEADKNQRYQSTLQFAANLLLQIQQQQQQQKTATNPAAHGSGNQQ
jgi:hypothetical protein